MLRKATAKISPRRRASGSASRTPPITLLRDWIAEGCRTDLDQAPTLVKVEVYPESGRVLREPFALAATAGPGPLRRRLDPRRHPDRLVHLVRGVASRPSSPTAWSRARTGARSPSASATSTRWSPGRSPSSRTCPASPGTTRRATTGSTTSSTPSSGSWAISRRRPAPTPSSSAGSTLDVLGLLPTVEETRAFLADTSPDKRSRLIDRLLERPEYAAYWGQRQADLLRVTRQSLTTEGARRYYDWIVESVRSNQPFDQFVRELLTSEGDTYRASLGQLLPGGGRHDERHRVDRPALHGRADRLCQVPQPPVRPLDAGQLLRDRRRLRPGPPRARARPAEGRRGAEGREEAGEARRGADDDQGRAPKARRSSPGPIRR